MILYKLLITLNATSWMLIIYVIKEGCTIGNFPRYLFGIVLLFVPVVLSGVSLIWSRHLGTESVVDNCKDFNLADGEFLPIYLGYFFVSVGVSEHFTMVVLYLIVFVFTFLSQTQYYNPIYLFLYITTITLQQKVGQKFLLSKKGQLSAISRIWNSITCTV